MMARIVLFEDALYSFPGCTGQVEWFKDSRVFTNSEALYWTD